MIVKIVPLLALLALVCATACSSMDDSFWESLGSLSYGAIDHFFRTAELPGEGSSSELASPPAFPLEHHSVQPHEQVGSSQQLMSGHDTQISRITSATYTDWIPPPLSAQQRRAILAEIAPMFETTYGGRRTPEIVPYDAQELTPKVLEQCFVYHGSKLRQLENGYFVIPRSRLGQHVGTNRRRAKTDLAFVWQRFEAPLRPGSIFRLIGYIEAAINVDRLVVNYKGFRTGSRDLTPLGTDSVIDHSELVPIS